MLLHAYRRVSFRDQRTEHSARLSRVLAAPAVFNDAMNARSLHTSTSILALHHDSLDADTFRANRSEEIYEPTRKRKLALPKNGRRRELCCCTTVRWIIIIMLSYPPAAWSPSRCSSKCKILCWRIMLICILLRYSYL